MGRKRLGKTWVNPYNLYLGALTVSIVDCLAIALLNITPNLSTRLWTLSPTLLELLDGYPLLSFPGHYTSLDIP
jgi:hypothetical protein